MIGAYLAASQISPRLLSAELNLDGTVKSSGGVSPQDGHNDFKSDNLLPGSPYSSSDLTANRPW